jgi:hypothetical protein
MTCDRADIKRNGNQTIKHKGKKSLFKDADSTENPRILTGFNRAISA